MYNSTSSQFVNSAAAGAGGAQQQSSFVYNHVYPTSAVHPQQIPYLQNGNAATQAGYFQPAGVFYNQHPSFGSPTDMQYAARHAHPQFAAPVVALSQTAGHAYMPYGYAPAGGMRQHAYPQTNAQMQQGQYYANSQNIMAAQYSQQQQAFLAAQQQNQHTAAAVAAAAASRQQQQMPASSYQTQSGATNLQMADSQSAQSGLYPQSYQSIAASTTPVLSSTDSLSQQPSAAPVAGGTQTVAPRAVGTPPIEEPSVPPTTVVNPVRKGIVIKDAVTNVAVSINEMVDQTKVSAGSDPPASKSSITILSPPASSADRTAESEITKKTRNQNSESKVEDSSALDESIPKDLSVSSEETTKTGSKKVNKDWNKDWSQIKDFVPAVKISDAPSIKLETSTAGGDATETAPPVENVPVSLASVSPLDKQADSVQKEEQQTIASPTITGVVVSRDPKDGSSDVTEVPVYTFEVPSKTKVELAMGENQKNFKPDVILSPMNEENPMVPSKKQEQSQKRSDTKNERSKNSKSFDSSRKKDGSRKSDDKKKGNTDNSGADKKSEKQEVKAEDIPSEESNITEDSSAVCPAEENYKTSDPVDVPKIDVKKDVAAPKEKTSTLDRQSSSGSTSKTSKKNKKSKVKERERANDSILDAYVEKASEESVSDPSTPRGDEEPSQAADAGKDSESTSANKEATGLPAENGKPPVANEDDLSWEDKPIADDKQTEGDDNVSDEQRKKDEDEEDEFASGCKTYDRDFLMSLQKNQASLKKGPFCQARDLKEIVLNQPNFLQTLPDSFMGSDMRSDSSFGNDSRNDFTPPFIRKGTSIPKSTPFQPMGQNIPQMGRQRSYNERQNFKTAPRVFSIQKPNESVFNITPSENAWKPKKKQDLSNLADEEIKTEEIKRKTRYILNRLTPQNFAALSQEMALLDIDTDERVHEVITIVFDKACLEPNFAEAYANICRTVLQIRTKRVQLLTTSATDENQRRIDDDPVIRGFRRSLLTSCQNEFQKEKDYEKTYADKKADIETTHENDDAVKKEKLADLEIEMRKAKKKSLGNIRFIGELFKLNFLTEKIMHDCIVTLLKAKDEDSLECLCKLLCTIGQKLDHEKGKKVMDQYFARMKNMTDSKATSSRIRFMLQDVLELRESKYQTKRDSNPKTIDQIHKEAHFKDLDMAQQAAQLKMKERRDHDQRKFSAPQQSRNANVNPQSQNEWVTQTLPHSSRNYVSNTEVKSILSKAGNTKFGGTTELKFGSSGSKANWSKGSGNTGGATGSMSNRSSTAADTAANRYHALQSYGEDALPSEPRSSSLDHRFNARGPSAQQRQQSKDELLKAVRQNSSSGAKDGARDSSPHFSAYASRSGGGGSADQVSTDSQKPAPEPLSQEALVNKVNMVIGELIDSGDVKEYCEVVQQEVPFTSHVDFIKCCIEYAIDKKEEVCSETGRLLYELVKSGIISKKSFAAGLSKTLINAVDLSCDIPRIWSNYGILIAPLVRDQLAFDRFPEITKCIIEDDKAKEFMAEIVLNAANTLGNDTVADMWNLCQMSWKSFVASYNTDADIEEFINMRNLAFTQATRRNETVSLESAENSLYDLLTNSSNSNNEIFTWIQAHLGSFVGQTQFVRMLMRNLCKACIRLDVSPYRFEPPTMEKRKDILMKYIDHDENLMFEALYSIQLLLHDFSHPPGLLAALFRSLYDHDIITEQAFFAWSSNEDPQYQTGKGVCTVNCKAFLSYLSEPVSDSD